MTERPDRIAEAITEAFGERCPDFEETCMACQAWAQYESLLDKIDGLSSDLDSAVETAFHRGATEWTRLNYPKHFARLSSPSPTRG